MLLAYEIYGHLFLLFFVFENGGQAREFLPAQNFGFKTALVFVQQSNCCNRLVVTILEGNASMVHYTGEVTVGLAIFYATAKTLTLVAVTKIAFVILIDPCMRSFQ